MDTTDLMRQDWDERARKDAFYYIATWRKDWNEESFFQSGEEDYQRLVAGVLERMPWDPRGKVMLELGCGAGRMTRSFSQRCQRVYAFRHFSGNAKTCEGAAPGSIQYRLDFEQWNRPFHPRRRRGGFCFQLHRSPTYAWTVEFALAAHSRMLLRAEARMVVFLFEFNSAPRMPTMNWKGTAWRGEWLISRGRWGWRQASRGIASFDRTISRHCGEELASGEPPSNAETVQPHD